MKKIDVGLDILNGGGEGSGKGKQVKYGVWWKGWEMVERVGGGGGRGVGMQLQKKDSRSRWGEWKKG